MPGLRTPVQRLCLRRRSATRGLCMPTHRLASNHRMMMGENEKLSRSSPKSLCFRLPPGYWETPGCQETAGLTLEMSPPKCSRL